MLKSRATRHGKDRRLQGGNMGSDRLLQTATQVGLSLAAQAAVQAGSKLFEEFEGNRYSQADFYRYGELTRLFTHHLKPELPSQWTLNQNRRPTYRIRTYSWSSYTNDLGTSRGRTLRYYRQSALIAEQVSLYLTARSKRWFGKGSPGDLLELFMSEWLHFAIIELPNYQYDDESIKQLEKRIHYLESVERHPDIFKPGFIQRKKNKYDVMQSIRQELEDCKRLARVQSTQESARDLLNTCCVNTSKLLSASLNSIYYARTRRVYDQPLKLQNYLNPEQSFLGKTTKGCYLAVASTHSGEILRDTAFMAGLDSFGEPPFDAERPLETDYFNPDFSPKEIKWATAKMDLPPWLKGEEVYYLKSTQKLAESLLRIAKLKRLLEQVCILAGDLGNVWAYGDKRGKLSLECLLFLLEKELQAFMTCYLIVYQTQNEKRRVYTQKVRGSQNTAENQNFNRVDIEKEAVQRWQEELLSTIQVLRGKMEGLTEVELGRIHERKGRMYKEVADFARQFYPNDYKSRFQLLDQDLTEEEAVAVFHLDKPLLDRGLIERQESGFFTDLFPDESYISWRQSYFMNFQSEYRKLAGLFAQFERGLATIETFSRVSTLAGQINKQLERMKTQANFKRPTWRLGWLFLELGWPFNRGLNQKVDFLLSEFDLLNQDVKSQLSESKFGAGKASARLVPEPRMDTRTMLWLHRKKSEPVYYQNHQSSLFKITRYAPANCTQGLRRFQNGRNSSLRVNG